jgi:hypothetical protein
MRRRRRGRLRLPNRGRDRAMAQPQRPALLLEAQAASARVACGGCCRNSSQRTGSTGGGGIQGRIEGVVAYASCLSSCDRSGGYRPVAARSLLSCTAGGGGRHIQLMFGAFPACPCGWARSRLPVTGPCRPISLLPFGGRLDGGAISLFQGPVQRWFRRRRRALCRARQAAL